MKLTRVEDIYAEKSNPKTDLMLVASFQAGLAYRVKGQRACHTASC